ncbi:hypothetical protein Rleg4DRAFT_7734 [Rhizobium leguminosarum bv. trifolii WSM2297]|uniref:Uncharacterized protein n=1 Tax=Rhizobium leguminosarum bv. trifolii WSM2297 TaxID=754762 RepID=J0WII4_RHILT|nr:hypothetical protein Rleg4DRAFT_7734 [Rhizobium leguminosarum bv. trifolii WSM2297]
MAGRRLIARRNHPSSCACFAAGWLTVSSVRHSNSGYNMENAGIGWIAAIIIGGIAGWLANVYEVQHGRPDDISAAALLMLGYADDKRLIVHRPLRSRRGRQHSRRAFRTSPTNRRTNQIHQHRRCRTERRDSGPRRQGPHTATCCCRNQSRGRTRSSSPEQRTKTLFLLKICIWVT